VNLADELIAKRKAKRYSGSVCTEEIQEVQIPSIQRPEKCSLRAHSRESQQNDD
jgi:hypothetical protein